MKTIRVKNLSKIDLTNYTNGTLFQTKKSMAILKDGELIPYLTESDVKKIVKKEVKKVMENGDK